MFDEKDGFIQLEWNNQEKPEKKKQKKTKKKKVKKAKLKDWVYRLLKNCKPSSMVSIFHDIRMENLVIYDNNDHPHIVKYKGSIDKSLLKKLKKKYPDAYVLINGGDGFFSRISVDTYVTLSKINRLVVHYELLSMEDDHDDDIRNIIAPIDRVIDSINELVRFHMSERTRVDTICDMCCRDFWYGIFETRYRIAVEYKSGKIAYFKDINDFFECVGLSLI